LVTCTQAVEFPALLEQRRFGGIEVLWFPLADHPAAEADDIAAGIEDGEHDAVAEAVVALARVAFDDQTAVDQRLVLVIAEDLGQVLPAVRCVAQAEAGGDLAGQAAPLQVVDGLRAGLELLPVILRGAGHEFSERGGFGSLLPALVGALLRHRQADLPCQVFHGLDEAEAGILHEEADGAAVRPAAEAVIELFRGADGKGRRLLAVEGTAGDIVRACLFQGQAALDDVDDVDAREEFLDEVLEHLLDHGNHHGVRHLDLVVHALLLDCRAQQAQGVLLRLVAGFHGGLPVFVDAGFEAHVFSLSGGYRPRPGSRT
jgi:hypothetical protein